VSSFVGDFLLLSSNLSFQFLSLCCHIFHFPELSFSRAQCHGCAVTKVPGLRRVPYLV
jgi:hypothetical protein